jgi:hypothetical protein
VKREWIEHVVAWPLEEDAEAHRCRLASPLPPSMNKPTTKTKKKLFQRNQDFRKKEREQQSLKTPKTKLRNTSLSLSKTHNLQDPKLPYAHCSKVLQKP